MATKDNVKVGVFAPNLLGLLIIIPALLLLLIGPKDFIWTFLSYIILIGGLTVLFGNSIDKINTPVKRKAFFGSAIFLIILTILVTIYGLFTMGVSKYTKNDEIKSIALSEKCVATINLKSGKTETIDIKSDVISKECKIKPVVSKDGKYAAFDLNLIIKDPDQKSGKSANNSSIVYMLGSDKWINAYSHGAGESTGLKFNDNNDLIVDIRYEGKDLEPWVVKNSDFEQIIKDEEERVLGLVKKQKDVVSWLKNFDPKTYLSRSNDGKAVIQIDRHDGDLIIVHVYEQFSTDGHRATFNWFKVNRFTSEITKEFDY